MKRSYASWVAWGGVLTALAFALSYAEFLLPIPWPVPGLKLGLANLVTLAALKALGWPMALCIVTVRCVVNALLFGGPVQLLFSLTGGLLACGVMAVTGRSRAFSVFGISVAGAFAHHTGQVAAAALLLRSSAVLAYLTILWPAAIPTGLLLALAFVTLEKGAKRLWTS